MMEFADDKPSDQQELKIKDYVVGDLPTLIYIPNFIADSEQSQLLHHIYEVPTSKWKNLKNRRLQNWGGVVHEKGLLPQELPAWLKKVTGRIRQCTGLFPSELNHVLINEYLPNQGIMPHQDGPAYFPVVAILSLKSPVVIDFTPHPRLRECASKESSGEELTIQSKAEEAEHDERHDGLLNTPKDSISPCSLLLMPCSLLIFKDQAYSDYLHGIQDTKLHRLDKVVNVSECMKLQKQEPSLSLEAESNHAIDETGFKRTDTRVSLTCRLVLKVHKNLFKF
ncbi:alpha-ketoglutarate-dependent dioxygenase alkB homolog 6-like [Dioscorea cayenensis subsp. rotundata]|uniref:Alpha-ketoglutarate-dependent dioxygenase alkB homolog 6-like n=1 Tax=Dioscorea cayennensis subsp. rotundata TaxID=55577 RepID=A0AB40AS41_DIOCR|nr:alpha-ketoglutarate-dependent dioxygenase alkB homolog 6-like [Dioscorea cayenensis subsp. rotundata]